MTGCGAITLRSERESERNKVNRIWKSCFNFLPAVTGAAWVRRLIKFGQTTLAGVFSHPLANSAGIVNCLIASSGMEKSAPAWESGRISWGPSVDALLRSGKRVVCYPRAIANYISAASSGLICHPVGNLGWLNDCVTQGSKAVALTPCLQRANSSQGLENLEKKIIPVRVNTELKFIFHDAARYFKFKQTPQLISE